MKTFFSISALLLVGSFVGSSALALGTEQSGRPVARPVAALRAIHANAKEAGENAAIYQWMRVNREVDRILADTRKVEKAFAADASSTVAVQSLQKAVRELRAGRLNHDVARIQEAARQIVDISDALLK